MLCQICGKGEGYICLYSELYECDSCHGTHEKKPDDTASWLSSMLKL